MENKPVNLCKITLTVSRMPKEVVFNVPRAIPSERKNTWLIKALEAREGTNIEDCIKPLIITKSSLLKVDAAFNSSGIVCSTWCIERDSKKAKEACLDKMESMVRMGMDRATEMSRIFYGYKLKNQQK